MNGKRTLALFLTVSIGAAALSILAEGTATGPVPEPSDLPGYETSAATDDYAEAIAAADAYAQYETVTGEWTLAELASMDAPPVTGDAEADSALEAQWRAVRAALENAAPDADVSAVMDAAAINPEAAAPESVPATSAPDAQAATNTANRQGGTGAAVTSDAQAGRSTAAAPDAQAGIGAAVTPDAPALTGDAQYDSQLEAEWKAAHPEAPEPETPEAVTDPADAPDAAAIAGPDDGGARPERTLDKIEQRDAQKRERIVAGATETAETLSGVSFAEVESRTRENNLTVRAMRESVTGLENMDYEKSEEDLLKILNGLSAQQDALSFMSNEPLAQSFAVSSLQSQYNSLYSTFEQLHDGTTRRNGQDAIEQMRNAMDQVVMGAETLYIALIAMQDQYTALNRQLESLNRTVEEMELRYSLGQISALTLNQTKSGRTALVSGMETLSMNIKTYKMQLENMLGAGLTGEIELGELPAVTEGQISALDADRDFSAARDKSYELYAAARTLQDARETFLSSGEQYRYNERNTSYQMAQHTWTAAQDTYNVTVRGYELKFRTLYEQVRDYYQVWNASKDALETQKQQYQASELQYKQGNISKNALLSAKDSLSEKEEAVRTAANNLFSSYNNYCWAVQSGILA